MCRDSKEVEKSIRQIIEDKIRPQLAIDGGDIVFHKYENGILYVSLQGACCGCAHAMVTLKMGVEARLKELVPELKEVVPV